MPVLLPTSSGTPTIRACSAPGHDRDRTAEAVPGLGGPGDPGRALGEGVLVVQVTHREDLHQAGRTGGAVLVRGADRQLGAGCADPARGERHLVTEQITGLAGVADAG